MRNEKMELIEATEATIDEAIDASGAAKKGTRAKAEKGQYKVMVSIQEILRSTGTEIAVDFATSANNARDQVAAMIGGNFAEMEKNAIGNYLATIDANGNDGERKFAVNFTKVECTKPTPEATPTLHKLEL